MCSEDGGVRHRRECFAPGGIVFGAGTRNNEGCLINFFSLTVYIIPYADAICNNRAISVCIQFGYHMLTEGITAVT